jgi:hypothetical protein
MKTKSALILVALLVGCATKPADTDHYQYSGSLESAEHAIAGGRPQGDLRRLVVEARGKTWVRYRVLYAPPPDQLLTNGTATVRLEHGEVSVSGSPVVRATIREALSDK